MAKPFVALGPFVPFGQEFLSESGSGTSYQLLPVEHDGILGEEEIYLSSDGGCIWSSGRQMVRGFQSVSTLGNTKVPSKILQAVRCTFSQLEHQNDGPRDARDGPCSFAGESWALLCASALLVKSDAEDFVAMLGVLQRGAVGTPDEAASDKTSTPDTPEVTRESEPGESRHEEQPETEPADLPDVIQGRFPVQTTTNLKLDPLKAKRVWALADGVLILVADSQGNEHAVTLVGHPFNLPRCISFIEAQASESSVKKDLLNEPGEGRRWPGMARLRWVSQDLPVALAYSPESRRHSVFLIRRRRLEAVEGLGDGGPSESALIQQAPSEVFLQRLHTIPEEGAWDLKGRMYLEAPDEVVRMPFSWQKIIY
eukprot:s124_g23.t1